MTASSSSSTLNSTLFVQPKYLTAAALAWTVVNSATTNPANRHKLFLNDDDDDDTEFLDAIPEIKEEEEESILQKKGRVVPVVVKPLTATAKSPTAVATPSPTQARVSAAAMRQIESRRRVRSAMQSHNVDSKNSNTASLRVATSSGASVASAKRASPRVVTPNEKIAMTSPTTTSSKKTPPKSSPFGQNSTVGSPPSVVDCRPVHFKVKSTTTGTVLRFQCVPTFATVQQNVVDRLRGASTATSRSTISSSSQWWSSATNMLLDSATNSAAVTMQFQDAEGDWCTLTNDDDLQDALEASFGRKDTMVRLMVQEQDAATRVWQSISTQWGW